jgi:hypothetical protein
VRRVQALRAALDRAEDGWPCAQQGCRLVEVDAVTRTRERADHDAQHALWRSGEWEHPAVRLLRAKVTEQADELGRLRAENGLLRRWARQRLNGGETPGWGA